MASDSSLKKTLTLYDVYAISTGAMFSSGFFLLPGIAAAETGPSVILAYLVAGLLILPSMYSMAELSTAMPKAGGTYYFLDRALGPLAGTVGGLGTWLALVFKSAFALIGMGAYLAIYANVPIKPLAAALAVAFGVLNIVGAKESSWLQRVLVTVLVAVLAFYAAQGVVSIWGGQSAGSGAAGEFAPFFTEGARGFLATIGIVFVSYAGLTKVASVAEEVQNPDRNIPLGMGLSLLTATTLYVVGVAIMVAVLPAADLHADLTPVYTSGEVFFNWLPYAIGPILIVVAAIAAFASTGNAGILSASRYPMAMARDKLLPDGFAKIGRFNTPTRSVIVTTALMLVVIFALSEEGVAKLASAFQLLIFALLNFAVIVMRESQIPSYAPGYRSPLYPWMQTAGIAIPLFLIAEMGTLAITLTGVVILFGIGWYFYYARTVPREGAIFHLFARMGKQRYEGLDHELHTILEEKGVGHDTAFDRLVARSDVMHLDEPVSYETVVEEVSARLADEFGISTETLTHGFLEGAPYSAVSVSHGAALPYCRLDGIEEPKMVMVHCRSGICVNVQDDIEEVDLSEPVYAFFFLVSPKDDQGEHLRTLATLANRVDEEQFLVEWRAAGNEQEVKESLLHHERYVTLHLLSGTNTEELIGRRVRDLNLPAGVLVALVRREEQIIVPSGPTTLHEGDRLTVIGSPAGIDRIYELYRKGEQEGVVR
ncbi:amino acid transporter [Salinibacter sp. 10B]|uniref:amino acid permease n=1 Tax=Salinibacter sp. 10B TaxID=1923971 RepID=UPI000CF3C982|nr:amino acid permease [Salinibacter sp. 10B]PQJ35296.1 amino acid transporter [Salinibacter sp. 10B]